MTTVMIGVAVPKKDVVDINKEVSPTCEYFQIVVCTFVHLACERVCFREVEE